MQYNTLYKYPFTVDILTWTDSGTINNPSLTWAYNRTVKAKIVNDGTGRVFLHVPSTENLRIQDRFNNIKDVAGELILPVAGSSVGQEYQVTEMEPSVNQFGYRVGIRYWGVKVS